MTKPKLTTGSLFGGLFKRAIQNVQLSDNAPDEMKQLLHDVQEALKPDDEENNVEPANVEIIKEEPRSEEKPHV